MSWNQTSSTQPHKTTIGSGIQIFIALILVITFLFGLVVNGLYLWVLGFRMKKSVNTTWFFHLILANLAFTFVLLFAIIQMCTSRHWTFGFVMCKLINSLLTIAICGAIFFLTVISLNCYLLVFAPHWHRMRMSPRYATVICLLLWGLSILFCTPYLIFHQVTNVNISIVCDTNYIMPSNWGNKLRQYQVKWSLFTIRVLTGYILPFVIISFCYFRIAIKMKSEQLTRSSKPYKIICVKIVSFFICLLPYYIKLGLITQGNFKESTWKVMWILTACFGCFYSCFTPLLYLRSVHSFKSIFKSSILSLIESVFKELSE